MSKCHNVRTVVRGLQLVFVTGIPTVLKITRADRDGTNSTIYTLPPL